MTSKYATLTTAAATARLKDLAEHPFDLSGDNTLASGDRLERYVAYSKPFSLLYATQRIDDDGLDRLQDLADECGLIEQFEQMRAGVVLNRIEGVDCENRQVLHTACRDLFATRPRCPEATDKMRIELARLKEFLTDLERGAIVNERGESFTTMINVGIGGSDLGPRAVHEALKAYGRPGRAVHFIANVDPDDAAAILDRVDLERTLVNIVSKSGTTLETLTNEMLVMARLRQAGLDPARHCLAVTGEGSPMDDPAKYLRSFYMWDYIGGRYSTSSMVGAVTLGFYLGYEQLLEFLRGAAEIDEAAATPDIRQNIPLLMALLGVWNHNLLGAASVAILPYSQALHRFPAHLQQCDMESNGKSVTREGRPVSAQTGPVVWGEPGTNGQHAFYQLLHQGTEIVPVEFIGFCASQYGRDMTVKSSTSQEKLIANMLAQSLALAVGQASDNPNRSFPGNRPSLILMAEKLTPKTMGALLAIYEAKIIFQGFIWNINSFDQEGVQLGKVLATRILERMALTDGQEKDLESRLVKIAMHGCVNTVSD
ncbi:MAG: glucose-6-phosphate isomerase [Desulfopila sp.]